MYSWQSGRPATSFSVTGDAEQETSNLWDSGLPVKGLVND